MAFIWRIILSHTWEKLAFLRKEEGIWLWKKKTPISATKLYMTFFHLKILVKFWLLTNSESREAEEITPFSQKSEASSYQTPSTVPVSQCLCDESMKRACNCCFAFSSNDLANGDDSLAFLKHVMLTVLETVGFSTERC